jgi:hypothetical protein
LHGATAIIAAISFGPRRALPSVGSIENYPGDTDVTLKLAILRSGDVQACGHHEAKSDRAPLVIEDAASQMPRDSYCGVAAT